MEIHVGFAVHRYEMYVCVGNFESQNDCCDLATAGYGFDALRYPLCKNRHAGKHLVVQIEKVIHLFFGYDERMAFGERVDVQKRKKIVVLRYLIAANLSVYYTGENRCHDIQYCLYFGFRISDSITARLKSNSKL